MQNPDESGEEPRSPRGSREIGAKARFSTLVKESARSFGDQARCENARSGSFGPCANGCRRVCAQFRLLRGSVEAVVEVQCRTILRELRANSGAVEEQEIDGLGRTGAAAGCCRRRSISAPSFLSMRFGLHRARTDGDPHDHFFLRRPACAPGPTAPRLRSRTSLATARERRRTAFRQSGPRVRPLAGNR